MLIEWQDGQESLGETPKAPSDFSVLTLFLRVWHNLSTFDLQRCIVTPADREQMTDLCRRIQEEQDNAKFAGLVEALRTLLDRKETLVKTQSVTPQKSGRIAS